MDAHGLVQRVQQLQERLGHTQDPRKISKTLKSLQGLDITLEILVETGVGKTVNGFRKHTQVGDIAKSIVNGWKRLVPEVPDHDQKPKLKWEHKETLENKNLTSKLKYEQNETEEETPTASDQDFRNVDAMGSQTGTLKMSSKTEKLKVSEKYEPKEKQSKQHKADNPYSHSHSKSGKSKNLQPTKSTEKLFHNTERKNLSSKGEEHSPELTRHKKDVRHTSVKQSMEQLDETVFSNEEFEVPTMSFESYLNYDQVSTKRKKKLYSAKEPPSKVQVCKQYCNMGEVRSEVQKSTEINQENLGSSTEVKQRCFEDLLNIPLPKVLPDYSIYPSPPHSSNCQVASVPEPLAEITEESSGFTGKRQNTKMLVYSGSKTIYLPKMLSLYEQCIRILQNNIDSIQEVGGVPFEILEPVLKRCTPEQLYRIEECNPVFMEDSAHLWKKHCDRDFKGQQLLEYESWREMYLRLFSEREEKLKMITQNISSTHSGKPKGRQVKLAYIHEAAKPPRNVRRKQEIHGTAGPIAQPHPLDKLKLQNVESKEPVTSNKNPKVPLSTNHYGGPCQDARKAVKKIAPMMAKSMRAFKNRVGPR